MIRPTLLAATAVLATSLGAAEATLSLSLVEPEAGCLAAAAALPIVQRTVAIDGDLADWGEAGGIDLPGDPRQQLIEGWRGPGDCSARMWLGWSAEALLIAVRVRDDRHHPLAGEAMWQGDSIQFATASDHLGPEFGVAAGADGTLTQCWAHGGPESLAIRAATRRDGEITTYEVAVPWPAVAGGRMPDGLLGFSLLVNDNDGDGRRGYIELTPGIGRTKDFAAYARLAFARPGPAAASLAFAGPAQVETGSDGSASVLAWAYIPPGPGAPNLEVHADAAGASCPLAPGRLNAVRIAWTPAAGSSLLALAVGGQHLERRIAVLSPAGVAALAARTAAARDALLAANAARPEPDAYARAAAAVAERTIVLASAKVNAGDAAGAAEDQRFATALCERLRGELAGLADGSLAPRPVPTPPLDRLRIARGSFWSGDAPVMLVGAMGYGEVKRDLDLLRDLGFTSVGTDFASGASLAMLSGPDRVDRARASELGEAIALCAGKGFTWSYTPSLHYFPLWALREHPDVTGGEPQSELPDWSGRHPERKAKSYGSFWPFSIYSPTVHELVGRFFAEIGPVLAAAPGTGVVWLMNEPRYSKDRDPACRERFQAFLRERHRDIATLNARWHTDFPDFTAIALPAVALAPGRYDYLCFHLREVGGWFAWLGAEARKACPGIRLSNKPMAWTLLEPESGIDFEREALDWEVPGCDADREPHDAQAAFKATDPALLLDFQKSVAPDKPLADHEYHWCHQPGLGADYSRATFLHSYLHGLRWSQFWVWSTGDLHPGDRSGGSGMQYTAASQPAVLWGAARAALDLRRLAPVFAAFPQPAQVAIAYSRPSLFLGGGAHRTRIITAWRAAVGLDAPVGFATDRMLREGRLDGVRLLLVPGDAWTEPEVLAGVQAFLDHGGTVARIGDCYGKDPYGAPLPALRQGPGRLLDIAAGEAPELAARLDPVFTAAGIARAVRVVATDGAPAWPIECRTAVVDGRRIVALVGFNPAERRIRLEGAQPIAAWEDLLDGERGTADAFVLHPYEVRLLRLAP